jgi:hypothetical protein
MREVVMTVTDLPAQTSVQYKNFGAIQKESKKKGIRKQIPEFGGGVGLFRENRLH